LSSKKQKWDEAYQDADYSTALPALVLEKNEYLLPESGDALDLACGRAGNAQFLANRNFRVDAIDISNVVLNGLEIFVKGQGLNIAPVLRDIENAGLPDKKYDLIVVSYYLHRELFPQIISALKPEGLLYYQTWSQQKVNDTGPSNPAFRLEKGELLKLSSGLEIILYRENGKLGDISKGLRNEAMLIAKKPK